MLSIPTIMMIALIISHTAAIFFIKKQRDKLDVSTPTGAAQAKKFNFIITILYIEMPILTAIIWLVVAPALSHAQ